MVSAVRRELGCVAELVHNDLIALRRGSEVTITNVALPRHLRGSWQGCLRRIVDVERCKILKIIFLNRIANFI